ncbi:MAG TPA: NRDE family protein [Burkholderiales bacterium]|nr:NRDE family protein [Burkholderiales bacterium]
MCLILIATGVHPDFPLIVAANRDEFHGRPTEVAGYWKDQPTLLAGRDLEAGGTWMGVSRNGRFAAVTNYRGGRDPNARESRGLLVSRFLAGSDPAADYVQGVASRGASYSGFNLLADDAHKLWWCSNRDSGARHLENGIYGLGNLLLDTPEVAGAKERFAAAMIPGPAIESLFEVLEASRIIAPEYGTRCSTVLFRHRHGRLHFAERPFDALGAPGPTVRYEFTI